MKHVFLVTSLLVLSGLSFLPGAQAEASPPAAAAIPEPCQDGFGHSRCAVAVGPCAADVRYYQHDSFFTESAACRIGNVHCGYYSHSLYRQWTGFDCVSDGPLVSTTDGDACEERSGYSECRYGVPACGLVVRYFYHDAFHQFDLDCPKLPTTASSTSAADPVDCRRPIDGHQFCEAEVGRCNVSEVLHRGHLTAHAECQPTDGKSRCGVYAAYPALEVTYRCMGGEGQVWPPAVSTASSAQPIQCWGLDGRLGCEVTAKTCRAGFHYERGELEDVSARCSQPSGVA